MARRWWKFGGVTFSRQKTVTASLYFDSASEEEGVTVISEQEVGAFDTVILTANNPMALTDWLDEHGYSHSIDDNAILQGYIDQKWVFTAMRLRVEFTDGGRRSARFFDQPIDPILLTYTAEKLIYPMRLTSISAREGTDVTVYILARIKCTFQARKLNTPTGLLIVSAMRFVYVIQLLVALSENHIT